MTTKKNEVAKKEETGLVLDERPDWMKNGSRGSEEVSSNDISLPRLQIIQDLSPQHKKTKPEYIEGAEVGDFFNTASNELYKTDLNIIPVYFRTEYVIWKDQNKGGGFFGAFPTEKEAAQELAKVLEQNNEKQEDFEIVDTSVHYVILLKPGSTASNPIMEQAVISMSKSQQKVSRNFNTMIKMAGGDRFSRVYNLSTVEDSNKAGQEYINWKVKPVGFVSKPMYEFGEETYESVKSGAVKADHGKAESSDDVASETANAQDGKGAGGDFEDDFS